MNIKTWVEVSQPEGRSRWFCLPWKITAIALIQIDNHCWQHSMIKPNKASKARFQDETQKK